MDERIVEQAAAEALVEESGGGDLIVVGAGRPGVVKMSLLGRLLQPFSITAIVQS